MLRPTISCRACVAVSVFPIIVILTVNGLYVGLLAKRPSWFWIHDVFTWLVLAPLCMWWALKRCRVTGSTFRLFGGSTSWPSRLFSARSLVSIALLPTTYLFASWLKLYWGIESLEHHPDFELSQVLPGYPWRAVVIAYMAATAAIVEEIVFRGLGYLVIVGQAEVRLRKVAYILVSSVLFATTHWENGTAEITATFIFGSVAAYRFTKNPDLLPLMIGHFIAVFAALAFRVP